MRIDYFCFSVPALGLTDFVLSENDDENTIWVKSKEKELMDSANENKMLIVFDRITKKFFLENEEIDIKDKVIFPRSFIPYEEELLTFLEKQGAISIQTNKGLKQIENWAQKIQPNYRKMIQTTYGEFQINAEKYRSILKNIFFKTVKKSHTHCVLKYFGYIDIGETKCFVTRPALWDVSLDDKVLLSNVFESIEDKENNMDCKEYRAFVLNNTLLSISRSYVDYPTKVPIEVISFVEEQINKASSITDFPNSYVLDVGQMLIDGNEVIDIIEYNSISSSGLEVCNLLVDELIEKQTSHSLVKKRINSNMQ